MEEMHCDVSMTGAMKQSKARGKERALGRGLCEPPRPGPAKGSLRRRNLSRDPGGGKELTQEEQAASAKALGHNVWRRARRKPGGSRARGTVEETRSTARR